MPKGIVFSSLNVLQLLTFLEITNAGDCLSGEGSLEAAWSNRVSFGKDVYMSWHHQPMLIQQGLQLKSVHSIQVLSEAHALLCIVSASKGCRCCQSD